jgi:hypothetical protein
MTGTFRVVKVLDLGQAAELLGLVTRRLRRARS